MFTLASDDDVDSLHQTMSTSNPHHGQDAAVLLSRTNVFAAFGSPSLVPHFSFWQIKGSEICPDLTFTSPGPCRFTTPTSPAR